LPITPRLHVRQDSSTGTRVPKPGIQHLGDPAQTRTTVDQRKYLPARKVYVTFLAGKY